MRKVLCIILITAMALTSSASLTINVSAGIEKGVQTQKLNTDEAFSLLNDEPNDAEGNKNETAPQGYTAINSNALDKKAIASFRSVYPDSANKCGDNLTWSLSGNTLSITGSGAMYDFNASYPGWYKNASKIEKIKISNGVTYIGEVAFQALPLLKTITIPESVTAMGEAVLYGCTGLESAVISNKLKVIPAGTFACCYSLSKISGAAGVEKIDEYAFQDTNLKAFQIAAKTKEISGLAFFRTKIESYSVASGNTVYTSKDGLLYADNGKTIIAYPQGNTKTSFSIPSGVTKIGQAAFIFCNNLKAITISNTVKTLASSAFQNCGSLLKIKISDSITMVDDFTFYGCSNLTSVTFGKGLKATSYQMFRACCNMTSINFGNTLEELYAHTFAYCESLTSVYLPPNIKIVGNGAFAECYDLESFTSKSLTCVPYSTFWNCDSLSTVILNDGIKTIYREAFYGCGSLSEITVPKSIHLIDSTAFPKSTKIICKNTGLSKYGRNGYRYLAGVRVSGTNHYKYAFDVLTLINKERNKVGLPNLVMSESLLNTAMTRAAETSLLFSHTRPDSSLCMYINENMTGENIAAGQNDPNSVVQSWMASEGHKKNILDKAYKTIGIGCYVDNGTLFWSQCFGVGTDNTNCAKPQNKGVTQKIYLATDEFDEAASGSGIVFFGGGNAPYKFALRLMPAANGIAVGTKTSVKVNIANPNFKSYSTEIYVSDVAFKSSDTAIASVSATGVITGNSVGRAVISASIGKLSGRYSFVVEAKKVSGITLSPVSANIAIGTTKQLTATVSPSNATNKAVTWSSGNTKVATVSSKGVVTAKAVGRTTITCKAKDGSGKKATCVITVVPKTPTGVKAASASYNSIKIRWTAVSGATGYAVYRAASKTGTYSYLKSTTSTSLTDTKLSVGKTYYYKVRAYKTVGGTKYHSGYSAIVSAKAVPSVPASFTAAKASSTSVKTSWKAVTGATGYEVWMATSSGGGYSKVAATTKTTYTKTKLTKNKTYYFKVRAYKTVGNTKVYGAFSAVKSAKPS